jgi:hypothetical protein
VPGATARETGELRISGASVRAGSTEQAVTRPPTNKPIQDFILLLKAENCTTQRAQGSQWSAEDFKNGSTKLSSALLGGLGVLCVERC